jgi:hypothetical protein
MFVRSLSLCLLTALLLAACTDGADESDVATPEALEIDPEAEGAEVPAAPEEIVEGVDELLGRWAVLEQAGTAPEDVYFVTFTREGDYVVEDETGYENEYTFRPAGESLIAITDATGTNRYTYEIDGRTLTLTVPGTETRTVLERRN